PEQRGPFSPSSRASDPDGTESRRCSCEVLPFRETLEHHRRDENRARNQPLRFLWLGVSPSSLDCSLPTAGKTAAHCPTGGSRIAAAKGREGDRGGKDNCDGAFPRCSKHSAQAGGASSS